MMARVGGFPWLESSARKAAKETMTTPNTDSTAGALVDGAETAGSKLAGPSARPNEPPIPTKTKITRIFVFPLQSSTPPGRTAKSCSGTCGRLWVA